MTGASGKVAKGLLKGLDDLEVGVRVETIQTTALLRTARILRRVLDTRGDLLSLKLQRKPPVNVDVKNNKGENTTTTTTNNNNNNNNNMSFETTLFSLNYPEDSLGATWVCSFWLFKSILSLSLSLSIYIYIYIKGINLSVLRFYRTTWKNQLDSNKTLR